MNSKLSLFLIFLTLLLSQGTGDYTSAPSPTTSPTDFIRTSCNKTLYPDVCYSSLSGYANSIQQDPSKLALVAIAVSLAKTRRMAEYMANLTGTHYTNHGSDSGSGSDARATSALKDCYSNFGDAVERIRDSLKQMREAKTSSSSGSFRFMISNVQTWMSAALTDEDTCEDGFESVPDGPMKKDLLQKDDEVKMYTSNALALVNYYAGSGTP